MNAAILILIVGAIVFFVCTLGVRMSKALLVRKRSARAAARARANWEEFCRAALNKGCDAPDGFLYCHIHKCGTP
jgi:hypothetical protein